MTSLRKFFFKVEYNILFITRRSSDDPLISGGTHDNQNDAEFPSIRVSSKSPSFMLPPSSPSIPTIEQKPHKKTRTRKKTQFKLRFHHQALPPEYLDHYESSQRQNDKQLQKEKQQQSNHTLQIPVTKHKQKTTNESVKDWLQKVTDVQQEHLNNNNKKSETIEPSSGITGNPKSSKVVSYQDLPYMGEMTLENSKPRRGRKPKKADICHLIYKNYGTIFPGTPKSFINKNKEGPVKNEPAKKQQCEPLNLCVRDNGEPFILSSSDGEESADTDSEMTPRLSPMTTTTNLKPIKEPVTPTTPSSTITENQSASPQNNFAFWPNNGVFIHPMALYYQKMVETSNANPTSPSSDLEIVTEPNHVPSTLLESSDIGKKQHKLIPRNISKLLKVPKPPSTPSISSDTTSPNSSKRNTPTLQKRKRSAIFIPPVPTEPKSHATEVSICKFKFTGGAKPTLQEKKMLSVDSGGNFRYYSGTGDKTMRGYEFFPRESLAASSLTANTTTNAFLNAVSEKIDIPPPSQGLSNELLQIPEFPNANTVAPLSSPVKQHHPHASNILSIDKKKRKSKRSVQRDNLEKTFKEKGFLIQTQQLQSAEGATYCKFRQLRKFTRYLYRSWKPYLPGDVQKQLVDSNGTPLQLPPGYTNMQISDAIESDS